MGNRTESGMGKGTRKRTGNVFFNGKPVCDDHWNFFSADIVCKELNFTGALNATSRSHFGRVPAVFSLDNVSCRGQESSLRDCPSSDVENCDGSEGAGVVCDARSREDRQQEDEKNTRECFSDAEYWFNNPPEDWINLSYRDGKNTLFAHIDSASSCQRACQHFEDCEVFRFKADSGSCYFGRLAVKENMRFKKTGRSSTMISGPRECNTKTPVLLSPKGRTVRIVAWPVWLADQVLGKESPT